MRAHWIALRRKTELHAILKEFRLDTSGAMEEVQSHLMTFINQGELSKEQLQRVLDLETSLGTWLTTCL